MTATASSPTSTNSSDMTVLSPGKQPLTQRQLSALFNSAEAEGTWKNHSKTSADLSLLYASIDSIASVGSGYGSADFWKSKDLVGLFASGESTKMPPLPPAGELFRSIDAAVGLMSVAQMFASKDFTSKDFRGDSVFASIDPLPFKSLDSVMSNTEAMMPDVPPTFALPGIYESREWLKLYESSHKEVPYGPEVFKSSASATQWAPTQTGSSKWNDFYQKALHRPVDVPPLLVPAPAPESTKPKPSPRKTKTILLKKKPPSKRGEPKEKIYVEPNTLDIISGRGGKSNSWPGNERYRAAIEEAKPAYREGAKYEKTIKSQDVVEQMMVEGRRFLKLDSAGPHKGEYYVMTKNQARKKAGQALREENTAESRKKKRDFYANKNQDA